MIDLNNKDILFAIDAVTKASNLVKHIQGELIDGTLSKDDKSPVTVADFSAQALVSYLMQTSLPGNVLVGEESASDLEIRDGKILLQKITAFLQELLPTTNEQKVVDLINFGTQQPTERYWTLDPIDGTKGFIRGQQYAVALALIENGEIQIGVLGCPNLSEGWKQDIGGEGSLIVAQKGKGCWVTKLNDQSNFSQLNVFPLKNAEEARLLRSRATSHTNVSQLDVIANNMSVKAEPVLLDSQAKYGILAAGKGDLLFRLISDKMPNYKEKIWDQAAGAIVVTEAGGKITDLDGKPLDFSHGRQLIKNRGVLASNGLLHQIALDAIRKAGA
jgi:3'(2'), 5'-bisphosphate nucleotidase